MKKLLFIYMLISLNLFSNEFWIEDLQTMKNLKVYENLKMEWKDYTLLNSFFILPVGSFFQGDILTLMNVSFIEAMGVALFFANLAQERIKLHFQIAGSITFLIGYFYGLIAPFLYSKRYNERLKNALEVNFIFDVEKDMVYKFAVKLGV